MDFRTELTVPVAPWHLDIGDPVVTMGSCFAQSIGQQFLSNKFRAIVNPFGTTYHPLAIHRLLDYSVSKEYPAPHTYVIQEGNISNYNFHSSLSAGSPEDLKHQLHDRIISVHYALKDCRVLLLTYGTAWLYERIDTGESVANCHRMPASLFSKRLATTEEITTSFRTTQAELIKINPDIRIVLTLSPVRHIKDTLTMNSVSKAVIRLACYELTEEFQNVYYFPAYELLIDDLRDYRFYKDDLIHPTEKAEDYIWEKFSGAYFSAKTKEFIKNWKTIQQSMAHQPFHPESTAHQQFVTRTIQQLEGLRSLVNVDREIQELNAYIHRQATPS